MDNITTTIPWPRELYSRHGAPQRLEGLQIFYDFPWRARFPDERTQFRNGLALARLAKRKCPVDKTPSILLTRDPSEREGFRPDPHHYLIVVNIDHYLANADGNAATTYFTALSSVDPIAAASIDLAALTPDQVSLLVEHRLDERILRQWSNASPERLAILARLVEDASSGVSDPLGISSANDAAQALLAVAGDNSWHALLQAGAQLPEALAHKRVWEGYWASAEAYRQHLADGDWTEAEWQRFFERNTWIFGYGLRYQFLHVLQERPYLGGRDFTRSGGQEGDFLMATEAALRFTVLVEIKKPESDLVKETTYRNRTFHLGEDLTGGVSQLQQQCWRWANEGSRASEALDLLESRGIYTHEPKSILVIGNIASLGGSRDKIRTFESFRSSLRHPEVLTFDELLARAQQIVATANSLGSSL